MRIAFAIMKLFPGGGLQRDCVEIARYCRQRGHEVVIFTSFKDASDFADDLAVAVLPIRQSTNHRMLEDFATSFRWVASLQGFDLVVGFDKLTHLDVLYCADPSVYFRMTAERFRFLIPRYRTYLALERATFEPERKTKVVMLSRKQLNEYRNVWHTPPERLSLLPPTISSARRHPEYRINGVRAALRTELGLMPRDWLWIAIGVQPHTKGLDRTMAALREFPMAKLLVIGLTETSTRAARAMAARARRLGLENRISFLGHREDIAEVMAAADLLVHPARRDTTGTVILEAVVNGLPVVTTSVCGYAQHVDAAEAGIVIDEPFEHTAFIAALSTAEDAGLRSRWSASAEHYGAQRFLYDGRARAAEIILAAAAERVHRRAKAAGEESPASAEVIYLHESGRMRDASVPS
ncbi:MAG TPA: glycosyltransferase family 4 protein [Xanthobacteraceae bacterium]|nr:glycosyltransferase family 4 protein [Xanthobacteraceae bacterium]